MRSDRPTRGQELVGRAALVVLALLLGALGAFLLKAGVRMAHAMAEIAAGPGGGLVVALFLFGAFLELVAATFLLCAFMPRHDPRHDPPRGFGVINALFDWFWICVRRFFGGSDL